MDFDQTQAIQISFDESETDDNDISKTPVSHLKLLKYKELFAKEYPLYEGENIIGRAETCDICIPTKALSKQHACIEVKSGSHLVFDKKSLNKTRRGKLFLQPEVRYELKDGDKLMFADVECTYHISLSTTANESGSETGSESMLIDLINNNNEREKEAKKEADFPPTLHEEDYADDSDASSDILQPTQCYQPTQKVLKATCSAFLVPDSDDESFHKGNDKNTSFSVTETPLPRSRQTKKLNTSDYVIAESGSETDDEGGGRQAEDSENVERILAEPTQKCIAESDDDETDNEADKDLLNAPTQMFPGTLACDEENEDSNEATIDLNAATQAVTDIDDVNTAGGVCSTVPYDMDISDTKTPSSNLSLSPIPKLGDCKRKILESITTDTDDDISHVAETQSFSAEDNAVCSTKKQSPPSLQENSNLDELIHEEEQIEEENDEVDMSHLLMPTLACDIVEDVIEEDEPEISGRNIDKETEDDSTQVLSGDETQMVEDTDKEMTAETQLVSDTSPEKPSASVRQSRGRNENSVDATVPVAKDTQPLKEDDDTTQPLSDAIDATQPIGNNSDMTQPFDAIKAKSEINKDATVCLDDPTMKIDEKGMASSEESTQVYETAPTQPVDETDDATVSLVDLGPVESSVGIHHKLSRRSMRNKTVPDNVPVEALGKDDQVPKRSGRGRKKHITAPSAEDATIPFEELTDIADSEKTSTKKGKGKKRSAGVTVSPHSDSNQEPPIDTNGSIVIPAKERKDHIEATLPLNSEEDLEQNQSHCVSPTKSATKNTGMISRRGQRNLEAADPLPSEEDLEPTQAYGASPIKSGTKSDDSVTSEISPLKLDCTIEATQPIGEDQETQSNASTVPLEATQAYCDGLPHSAESLARERITDAVASTSKDEEDSEADTLPVEDIEFVPDSESPEEDKPPLIPIPSRSPHKPTLVSPKNSPRNRSASPSPKRVVFVGVKDQTPPDDDEMSPVIDCQDTTDSEKPTSEPAATSSKRRTRGRNSGAGADATDTKAPSNTSEISQTDMVAKTVEKRVSKRGRGRASKTPKDSENVAEGNTAALSDSRDEESQENLKAHASNDRRNKGKKQVDPSSRKDQDSKVTNNEPTEIKAKSTRKGRGKQSDEEKSEVGGSEAFAGSSPKKKQEIPTEVKLTRRSRGMGVNQSIKGVPKSGTDSAQVVVDPLPDLKTPVEAAVEEPVKKSSRSGRGKNVTATSSGQPDLASLDGEQSIENPAEANSSKESTTKRTRRGRPSQPPKKFEDFEDKAEKVKAPKNIGKVKVSNVDHTTESNPQPKGTSSNKSTTEESTKITQDVQENEIASRRRGRRSVPATSWNSGASKEQSSNLNITICEGNVIKENLTLSTLPEIASRTSNRRGRTTTKRSRSDSADNTSLGRSKRSKPSENELAGPSSKEEREVVEDLPEITESPSSRRLSHKNNSQEKTEAANHGGKQATRNKSKKTSKEEVEGTGDSVMDSEPTVIQTPKGNKRRGQGDGSRERDLSASASKVSKRGDGTATPSRVKTDLEPISSPTLRKKDPKPRVMFTGVVDEQGKKIVKELGGTLAESIQECSHLVTDKIRRTVKLLGGLCLGLQIVSPQWLEQSKKSGMFLDGSRFIVHDKVAEKQYKFTLTNSISIAAGHRLLQGYKIHVTKSVKPDPDTMKEILECAGAEFIKAMPKKKEDSLIVISCDEDKKVCDPALAENIDVVSSEFILTGILRQKVDIESFRLFREASTSSKTTAKSKGRKR